MGMFAGKTMAVGGSFPWRVLLPQKLAKVFMDNERRFYTYAYLREDGTPYYIGKGQGKRAHRKSKHEVNPPKDKSRVIFLKKNLTEEEAFKHEIYMIAVFGRKDLGTGILRNKTNGGDGPGNPSKETREKLKKGAEKVHQEKNEDGKSKHAVRVGKKTLSILRERDINHQSKAAKKACEKNHREKDENGKSKHAVKMAKKTHEAKDENGRSVVAMKTNNQIWESTIDGFRSNAGAVAYHNKANGWDPKARVRVEVD
jgi:hypothetical protein